MFALLDSINIIKADEELCSLRFVSAALQYGSMQPLSPCWSFVKINYFMVVFVLISYDIPSILQPIL